MRKISPRYEEIAFDIATMIMNGELEEGDRISGRSTLASKYGVSPETIRRAVILLKDLGVVDSAPKSGIKVLSARKAIEYINQYYNRSSFTEMKSEIADILKEKNDLEHKLTNKINKMVDHLTLHRDIGIIYPLEVDIPASSSLLGKKICEIEFWNYTGATIIGIKREGNNTLSPNPEWILEAEDTIVFVGKKNSYSRVVDFVKQ